MMIQKTTTDPQKTELGACTLGFPGTGCLI